VINIKNIDKEVDKMSTTRKTFKLLFLTALGGLIMGVVSKVFLDTLSFVSLFRETHNRILFLLPFVGMLTAFVYKNYGKGSQRGNNLIIDSIYKDSRVPLRMSLFTFVFTVLTHLSGGSAGREGTAVQIGGTITNKLAELFKIDSNDRKILVMSGISAGFGSVFGTPLAGTFFGMEMCFVGKLSYEALLPCFVASYTSDFITETLGVVHSSHVIAAVPQLTSYVLFVTIMASATFGITGKYFSVFIRLLKKTYAKIIKNYVLRALLSSTAILFIMLTFNLTKYEGLSTWMIDEGFEGSVHVYDPFAKLILTCMTLGAGFQGGEVTPLFDIGASLGGLIGQITDVEPSLLAALGLISVFGCATNTPITTIMLGIEMFGTEAVPYYITASLISYYVSGHNGIYQSQIIYTPKFEYLNEHNNLSLEEILSANENNTEEKVHN
jgi:H+/Cl- antiporter ClcA